MTTTAWRFSGTEGADEAVLLLRQLQEQDVIDVEDLAIIRWPRYASSPIVQEHVTEGDKLTSLTRRLRRSAIDSSMIESVKGDVPPGNSALVLLSSGAAIGKVATAFQGHAMELVRSDLSVQQQDELRSAFGNPPGGATD